MNLTSIKYRKFNCKNVENIIVNFTVLLECI